MTYLRIIEICGICFILGMLTIIALNTADKVVTVNVWPSVLTAHGEL